MVKRVVNKTVNSIKQWFNRLTVQGLLKMALLLVILYLILGIFFTPTIKVVYKDGITRPKAIKKVSTAVQRKSTPTRTTTPRTTRRTTVPRTR
jgi:hypothetical protein